MWYAYINIYVYIIDNWYIVNLHLLENLKGFFGSRVTFSKSTPLDSAVLPKGIPGTLGTRRKEAFRTLTELKAAPTAFLTVMGSWWQRSEIFRPQYWCPVYEGILLKAQLQSSFPRISIRNMRRVMVIVIFRDPQNPSCWGAVYLSKSANEEKQKQKQTKQGICHWRKWIYTPLATLNPQGFYNQTRQVGQTRIHKAAKTWDGEVNL